MDPCRGGIACEICLGWVLLLFVDTAAGLHHRPPAPRPGCASKPARALHTGPSGTLHTGPSGALHTGPSGTLHTGPSGTLHTGGAWCPVGEPQLCLTFGTKFSLLSFLAVTTVQNSPCI